MITTFAQSAEELRALLAVARGDTPADLLLIGGRLVNVLSGEIYPAEVAIYRDRIAAVATTPGTYHAAQTLDLQGEYLAPGFIDAHVHVESSLLTPAEFAGAILPRGTTAIVSDPHEIANVHGLDGIRYMLAASEGLALRVFVMLSSCVPATDMETAGASLDAAALATLLDAPRVLGIAEMMNYPGVAGGAPDMLAKALLGHHARLRVDGHAPLLSGPQLQAYLAAGVASDHECTRPDEALEKLRSGMRVLIREGSTAKNLDALLPIVNERTAPFCSFATDDKQPDDLLREGHLDHVLRRAIAAGLAPMLALRMVTIYTARHYGLNDMGAVAPGYLADLVTFADLHEPRVTRTFAGGQLVAEQGRLLVPQRSSVAPPVNHVTSAALTEAAFALPARGTRIRAIEVVPEQIVTRDAVVAAPIQNGYVVAAPERDLLKIAVVERHHGTGNIGVGVLKGFGLQSGALASTFAHDSHNIVVVGASDAEMLLAVRTVVEMGGGICAVRGADVLGRLPLPIAGLMSDQPFETVRVGIAHLLEVARELGCPLSNAYMAMGFLALPVIPDLKITDKGLVDVRAFALASPFVAAPESTP
ncbi:MAG: Adenine deaminase [Ktedonobacterales bacterium]|jgi:adenine deaminase|nr:MAG: Adenine deaminase [Ktedonobacterales bacterium]